MPKSPVVAGMDHIQASLAPVFRAHSFRKKGRTYNRVTDDGLTQVVNFQTAGYTPIVPVLPSSLAGPSYGSFTVNLGVFVPEIAELDIAPPPKWITEVYCALRARLPETMGWEEDVWWHTHGGDAVIDQLRDWLEQGGLPLFLDRFSSRQAVLDWVDVDQAHREFCFSPPRILAAILLRECGDLDAARARMQRQFEDATAQGETGHAETVKERAVRWGIMWGKG